MLEFTSLLPPGWVLVVWVLRGPIMLDSCLNEGDCCGVSGGMEFG